MELDFNINIMMIVVEKHNRRLGERMVRSSEAHYVGLGIAHTFWGTETSPEPQPPQASISKEKNYL